jgi:hypothetical protein
MSGHKRLLSSNGVKLGGEKKGVGSRIRVYESIIVKRGRGSFGIKSCFGKGPQKPA